MRKSISLIIVIVFGVILLTSLVLPFAFAQRPTQQILNDLENRDKFGCEVFQINEFFHLPIRVNLVHDSVVDHQVKVTSQDPASEVYWEGSKTSFQMVTSAPDRHSIEVVLDYEIKHEDPRQVFYQIYSQDNVLMMEGNWRHEGFTFCKVIEMSTSDAPHILTAEEIQEENNKFNADFRKETAEKFTVLEEAQITYGIVMLLMSIMVGAFLLVAIMMYRKTATVANKPVKKLEEMINIHRNVNKNLQMVNDNNTRIMTELKQGVLNSIKNSIEDLTIIARQTKEKIEASDAFPRPKSLVNVEEKKVNAGATIKPIKKPNDEKESIKSKIGGFAKIVKKEKHEPIPETKIPEWTELPKDEKIQLKSNKTLQVDHDIKFNKDLEITEHTVSAYEKQSEPEPIEPSYNDEGMLECDTCGDALEEMLQCPHCTRVYCSNHYDDHKCLKEIPPEPSSIDKEKLKKAGTFIKDQFIEPKPPKLTDDASIMKSMEMGTSHAMIMKQLEDEFTKSSRKENEELYHKMNQEYAKDPTVATGMKLSAMVNVLNKQVRY